MTICNQSDCIISAYPFEDRNKRKRLCLLVSGYQLTFVHCRHREVRGPEVRYLLRRQQAQAERGHGPCRQSLHLVLGRADDRCRSCRT